MIPGREPEPIYQIVVNLMQDGNIQLHVTRSPDAPDPDPYIGAVLLQTAANQIAQAMANPRAIVEYLSRRGGRVVRI
jgi:hypothetical protein